MRRASIVSLLATVFLVSLLRADQGGVPPLAFPPREPPPPPGPVNPGVPHLGNPPQLPQPGFLPAFAPSPSIVNCPAACAAPVDCAMPSLQCEIPAPCPPVPCPPQTVRRVVPRTTYQTVTKTIMVPNTVMETRPNQSVEYRDEVRERVCTVYDQVPETRQVTTEHTVMVPETRERTETFTVQVPCERLVPETYTVDNVQTETRTRTRIVCRCIPTTEMRTVHTGGEVIKRSVNSPNGGVKVQTAIVDDCVKQVPVTVMRKQLVEQTIAYDVEVTRPETRTRYVTQTDYRPETRTRTVPEVVQVPRVETRVHNVTEMKTVPRQKKETYTERVPHIVTNTIQVPVTTMVPKQITQQIPVTTYDVIEEPISDCSPWTTFPNGILQ